MRKVKVYVFFFNGVILLTRQELSCRGAANTITIIVEKVFR